MRSSLGGATTDGPGTSSGPTAEAKKGGTLKVLSEEDFTAYDTAPAYDTNTYHLLRVTDRQLYTNMSGEDDARTDMIPDLAAELPEITEDGTLYTMTLKDNVQWNTTPARAITTADAIRGFQFMCNPDDPFGAPGYFTDTIVGYKQFCDGFAQVATGDVAATKAYVEGNTISGITAVDDKTLTIKLTKPAADFIHLIALPTVSPRPVEAVQYLADSPEYRMNKIESGPYQVESYVPDTSLTLTRNPAWIAESDTVRPANVDQIDMTFGISTENIQQQIDAGTADLAVGNTAPPAAALSQIPETDERLELNSTGGLNPYAVFNTLGGKAALKNKEVRVALNYAANKRNIVQVVGGTKVASPGTQILPPSVVGEVHQRQDIYATPDSAGDPERAKQMLADAGFPNLELIMAFRASGNGPAIAATMQEDYAKAGVTLTLLPQPNKDFYSNFIQKTAIAESGAWDIALPGWSPDWEGASERSFFTPLLDGRVYSDGSTNYGKYDNPAVNTAADAALSAPDQASSAQQWNAIDKTVMEDAPWIPLIEQTQANFHSDRVDGFAYYFSASNGDLANFFIK